MTCDDVHDWQDVSDENFDGADDGESTTILQASGRGVCCYQEEVQLFQRLADGVDCLSVFRCSFVAFNLAECVAVYIILGDFAIEHIFTTT